MKKLLVLFLSISIIFLMTACGVKKDSDQPTAAPAESKSEKESKYEKETIAETAAKDISDSSKSENFTLLDVTEDMIDFGLYATNENEDGGLEFVFAKFKTPDGSNMVSLMSFSNDDASDALVCGTYTETSETDKDGTEWIVCTVNDVYTGEAVEIGFANTREEIYIIDEEENSYKATYLSAAETIEYMSTVVGLSMANAESAAASKDFTLLDVTSKMIEVGVYAVDANNKELVLSLFTIPDGTKMASLFVFESDGKNGDIICGTYENTYEADADGITWSLCTVSDIYTSESFEIGFGEAGGEVYIFDADGNHYKGEYLTANKTIDYMGAAIALSD